MVVHTQTERVLETRKSIMEFHLVNHPLDCPVCDQAGECWLQIYYMRHGLYDPRMIDEKVHKPKAVPLGPHVMLDAERCILCSRCVRFCDEVTKTGELGIFNRGDHSEIGLFPGKTLENKYSGNVIDICPVGALTDRDFRFQVRVWYLDTARSVCNGCARGCNIEVHTSRRRPHHNQGRRIARIKPRHNPDVNQWWICDEGRYGFRWIDDDSRLLTPHAAGGRQGRRPRLGRGGGRPWWRRSSATGRRRSASSPRPRCPTRTSSRCSGSRPSSASARSITGCRRGWPGDEDNLLIRADKNPNRRGAELIGLGPGGRPRAILDGARAASGQAACGSSSTTCSTRAGPRPT